MDLDKIAALHPAAQVACIVCGAAVACFVEFWHARYEAYDDGDGTGAYLPHWQATEEYPETYEG